MHRRLYFEPEIKFNLEGRKLYDADLWAFYKNENYTVLFDDFFELIAKLAIIKFILIREKIKKRRIWKVKFDILQNPIITKCYKIHKYFDRFPPLNNLINHEKARRYKNNKRRGDKNIYVRHEFSPSRWNEKQESVQQPTHLKTMLCIIVT